MRDNEELPPPVPKGGSLRELPPLYNTTNTSASSSASLRNPSDLYSFNDDHSYNSWRYGDEASLYSIAEDSREDRSELASDVGGNYLESANGEDPESRVEVKWLADEVPSPSPTLSMTILGTETQDSDEHEKKRGDGRAPLRKKMIAGGLLLALVAVGVIVGVAMVGSNKNSTNGGSGIVTPPQGNTTFFSTKPTQTPSTQNPTASPTMKPTLEPSRQVAYLKVFQALRECSIETVLLDTTTLQHDILQQLVDEVNNGMTVNADGTGYNFLPNHKTDALRERYALDVLFRATSGDRWFRSYGWPPQYNLCSSGSFTYGVVCLSSGGDGNCTVGGLQLGNNNMLGNIPRELCCMPCLSVLQLNNNRLFGTPPSCLLNTVATIDLSNNNNLANFSIQSAQLP